MCASTTCCSERRNISDSEKRSHMLMWCRLAVRTGAGEPVGHGSGCGSPESSLESSPGEGGGSGVIRLEERFGLFLHFFLNRKELFCGAAFDY